MSTNLWICHRCGQPFLPGVLTHICGNTSLSNDEWQAVQRERDELRAEVARLHEIASAAQRRQEELEPEYERLRADLADLLPRLDADAMHINNLARELKQADAENKDVEELREELSRQGKEWDLAFQQHLRLR